MSKDIPKAPITVRLYTLIRNLLSAKHTSLYMVIESILIGSMTIGAMYYFGALNPLIYGATGLGFILPSISIYFMTEPAKRKYPTRTMDISMVKYLLVASILIIGIPAYGYVQEELTLIYYMSTGCISMYTASVLKRSQKYKGDRDYFTDKYSSANKEWERASVALEKALDSRDDSVNESYFWAKKAESIYEGIIEKEDRTMQREAAGMFATACGFVAASVFTESNESYSLWKAAEKSIQQAKNHLSVRICDICGQKKPVENCTASIEDAERKIYCQRCVNREQQKQRQKASQERQKRTRTNNKDKKSRENKKNRGTTNSSNKRKTSQSNTKQSSRNTQSNDRNKSRQNTPMNSESNDKMSTETALEVLELDEKPKNASEVHKAFRDKVKEAHPDMGGSEDQFRKVKKAREILVNSY